MIWLCCCVNGLLCIDACWFFGILFLLNLIKTVDFWDLIYIENEKFEKFVVILWLRVLNLLFYIELFSFVSKYFYCICSKCVSVCVCVWLCVVYKYDACMYMSVLISMNVCVLYSLMQVFECLNGCYICIYVSIWYYS